MKKNKIIVNSDKDQLLQFLNVLEDLSKISDVVRFKEDEDGKIFSYAIQGKGRQFTVFKFFLEDFGKYFDESPEKLDCTLFNSSRIVKQLKFFMDFDLPLTWNFTCIDGRDADASQNLCQIISISNGRFESRFVCADPMPNQNFTIDKIRGVTNPELIQWSFTFENEDFTRIQKLNALNKSTETVTFKVEDSKMFAIDKTWNIEVGYMDPKHNGQSAEIQKKYLALLKPENEAEIKVFSHFAMVSGSTSHLLVSLDLSTY